MIIEIIKKLIEDIVLTTWPFVTLPSFTVEISKQYRHLDYASNISMMLTKILKQSPDLIAKIIAKELISDSKIEYVDIVRPGFINIKISNYILQQSVKNVISSGSHYGTCRSTGKKVLLEFVSANPTGPLHLGHARSMFLGDAIARILQASGYDVTKEFYVNDIGNQIETLGNTIYVRYLQLFGINIELGENAYPGDYVIEIAKHLKAQDGDKWIDRDDYLQRCIEIGIEENLKNIKKVLDFCGIKFDSWYSEKLLHDRNRIKDILDEYEKLSILYNANEALDVVNKIRRENSQAAKYADRQEGGIFLKTTQFGDEEDRILVRKNGVPVYLAADIAYHKEKIDRGFDRIINIFGADHAGHVSKMQACLRALGLKDIKKLEFCLVQMVHLLKDGEDIRFSKRAGKIVNLDDFIKLVGIDIARFIFLMKSPDTQFAFDLDLLKSTGSDNLLYYIQYGHARIASLLSRFEKIEKNQNITLEKLTLPEELNMMKKIDFYPEIVKLAALNLEPHRILFFCKELISEFHCYYTKYKHTEKIISDNAELTLARIALVSAVKQVVFNSLALIGISAPETMYCSEKADSD